jgi:hypothetical protein
VKNILRTILCVISFLQLCINTTFAAPPPDTSNNSCPKGYACCPDLSNTPGIDLTAWQLTGQPLPKNIFGMVWWTSIGRVGYVTCYYNVYTGNPFTLESVMPVKKPARDDKHWKSSSMEGTLTCMNSNVAACTFQFDQTE